MSRQQSFPLFSFPWSTVHMFPEEANFSQVNKASGKAPSAPAGWGFCCLSHFLCQWKQEFELRCCFWYLRLFHRPLRWRNEDTWWDTNQFIYKMQICLIPLPVRTWSAPSLHPSSPHASCPPTCCWHRLPHLPIPAETRKSIGVSRPDIISFPSLREAEGEGWKWAPCLELTGSRGGEQ